MKYIKFRERYIVSDTGLIWAIKKDGLKLKKQRITPKGYKTTNIDKVPLFVHRIVMEAFKGKSDLTVDHIDGNAQNNNLSNLEYVTQAENTRRMFERVGTAHLKNNFNGEIYGCKKLVYKGLKFNSINELARKMGLNRTTVKNRIKKGILNVEFEG